ncbi:MAG TPA: hypothetical protein VGH46_10205 [Gaiellaceae bacterium]
MAKSPAGIAAVDCCPELEPCDVCDYLDFTFRLPFRPASNPGEVNLPILILLRFRLSRCSGPLSLGDIAYSTTLLPGETVRLFTSDRHSRFSFDSETDLSYRQHTTSEESMFMAGMANAVSNVNVNQNAGSTSSFHSSAVGGGGGLGIDLGFFSIGGSASGSSYDSKATSQFASNLSQHADSSSRNMEISTRAASSTSIGEVSTRAHSEGTSEDQYESSSRTFVNPNHCHALTYLFYKLNKCQILRWELVGIDRIVVDRAAPTDVQLNDPPPSNGVTVIPDGIIATSDKRAAVQQNASSALAAEQTNLRFFSAAAFAGAAGTQGISAAQRDAALQAVDAELVKEGLLTKDGQVSAQAQKLFGWEREIALPTAGIIVKGCLDECDTCEPSLEREIELDLQRKHLENELLKRQIDLLDKAQEYRCCPDDSDEPEPST